MEKNNIIVIIAIGLITFSFWALVNRPEEEPTWPKTIQGFSFQPMRLEHDPVSGILPTVDQIDEDLVLLSEKTYAVRTYSVEGTLSEIPKLAQPHGINVALGAWINGDPLKDNVEFEKMIHIAATQPQNIVRVIVGNEAILRGDITIDKLAYYLERARLQLDIPVSTAEPWHVWVKHPELARHVDYIAVHMLPYWEGIDLDVSIDYIVDKINMLKQQFPDKPVIIAEVGWPSNGRTRQSAVASESNQGIFLRRFLARAQQENYIYYIIEAFDQPWKQKEEGAVGAYWGVWDVNRQPKFEFSKPIVEIPQWRILAALSIFIAMLTLTVLFVDSKTLKRRGRSFLAIITYAAASVGVWVTYDYTRQYLTVTSVVVGVLLITGMIGIIVIVLTEAHEFVEALWFKSLRRPLKPFYLPDHELPMVSIHVPAYNEPPDMMKSTLEALAAMDYPNYEVIVIDNNTKDPNVWTPVREYCATLGPRFHFFHEDTLPGFKAGALNYALDRTSTDAEIIAAIDSDYIVDPRWLRELTPQFQKPEVAIVQAPQDYRDNSENAFKGMSYAEYRGFFYIGMITRNERNAIIQHGTMTLVRRRSLEEAGRWSEWCITEDAELGLKIFELGYEALYIPKTFGRGLIPDRFEDYKKQRFRWTYGAIQILRRHASNLCGIRPSCLSFGQRYHFIAGWLPWIADGFNLMYNLAAISWSFAMLAAPKQVDPPLSIFSILHLSLFIFKVGKLLYLYRTRVGADFMQTIAAAIAGLSLAHSIARAVLWGFFTKDLPFFRTPKLEKAGRLRQSLMAAREEILMFIAMWLSAFGIIALHGADSPDMMLWFIMLIIQALPYFASLLMAIAGGLPKLPAGNLAREWTNTIEEI